MRGDGRLYLRGKVYWVCYYLRGVQHREAAKDRNGNGVTDSTLALKFLKARLKEVHADEVGGPAFTTPRASRLTVHDILTSLKNQFEENDQWTAQNRSHWKRADEDFGISLAARLTPEKFDEYRKRRLADGDKPASINRPLQLIRQAYILAINRNELSRVPYIRFLSEKGNARKGFCEETEFRNIMNFLPEYLKDFALFGYCTGMRCGEIRSLKWEYVKGDVIELQAEDAKGDGGEENARLIPMVGRDLSGVLERRKAARQVKDNAGNTALAALLFHHNGHAIVDIRKAWKSACKKAGVPNRLFHDLRRSAVKNLDEAGVPRDVAMSLSGHRSQSMYSRYNISDVKRKRTALEKVQEFRDRMAAEQAAQSNVVAMR